MVNDDITLKEYLEVLISTNDRRYEQRFNDTKIAVDAALIAADKAVAAALAGQKEAVTKAEVAAEKRFESVNEFRNTLSDQQRMLLPRLEAEVKFVNIEKNFDSMQKEISSLRESRANHTGVGTGMKEIWGYIVGAIGLLVLLLNAFGII
jgi:hypothetical protein